MKNWRNRSLEASEGKMKGKMKLKIIIDKFTEQMQARNEEGAADVLDVMFFAEWPQLELRTGEKTKFLADIRGLAVECYKAGHAAAKGLR